MYNAKNHCPFINGSCRDDCVFKCNNVASGRGIYSCLIAVKLDDINEHQSDQLNEITQNTSTK